MRAPSPFDFSLPFSSSSSAHRLSLSLTLPDVAEMGTQPRRRLQTFLSGLFTELQFLVFATFLYITGPVTRILLSPTFSLCPSLLCFFLSFFLYRYIDRSIFFTPLSIIFRELIYYYYYYLIIETKDQLSLKKNDFNSIKIYFDIRVGLDERRGSIIALRDEYNTPLRIHSPLITIITIIT